MKNLVFDFGGVLVDWNPRYLFDRYFSDPAKSIWFIDNICTGEWNAQMDAGKPFDEGVAELCAVHPEWTAAIEAYRDRWSEMMGGATPGMYELVRDWKARGFHVYGLTNWSAETLPGVRKDYPVFSLLEGTVVSGEEKVAKPDPAIFRILLDRFALDPSETIFIDDNRKNVDAAASLGITPVRFISPKLLDMDLELMTK